MKVKTWQILLSLILSVLVPVAFVASTMARNTQTPHSIQHATPGDFWDSLRMKPVKVTEVQGKTVYWTFQDKSRIELGSFETDERTALPKDFKEGKVYLVIYCESHKVAYEFQEWK